MTSSQLGYFGRVAVITGAGGGLGKQYALEFAKRGASIVVNDLGGTFNGEGQGTQLADQVVKEIKELGDPTVGERALLKATSKHQASVIERGKAVANYDSVEHGEKIIETAISNFGKVDILVNNAGILRDRSFMKMSDEDWDKIFQVHVKGSFSVTKAAWPHMRKQKYGRIIMTTSAAGLYGNFGQANYSAAKMALVGFTNTLSKEGAKSNIHVNAIAPLAQTRMTEGILPLESSAEHICPFVVYMCHESCEENGSVIETAAGYAWKTKYVQSQGLQLRQYLADVPTVESVARNWHKLTDFTTMQHINDVVGINKTIMESLETLPEKPIPDNASAYERIVSFRVPESKFFYTVDDAIRYAFSVGASLPGDSSLLYEGHPSFSVLPSFATIVGMGAAFNSLTEGVTGMEEVDVSRVLHGEQYVEMFKPFPAHSTRLTTKTRISDVLNKRKFLQLIMDSEVYDEGGEMLCRCQIVTLFLGSYGIGKRGKSEAQVSPLPPPARTPDAVYEEVTSGSQAAIYRLNGDKNPLHIDPEFARMLGFEQPILHGLCSYGYATRHVIKTFANNDASLVKSIKGQFSKPVIPGQTLVTEMWQDGRRVYYQMKVKETNEVVIKGGFIDFNSDLKKTTRSSVETTSVQTTPPNLDSAANCSLKATGLFDELERKLKSFPENVAKIKGAFLFQITKENKLAGEWLVDFNSIPIAIIYGASSTKPDVTIKVADEDFESLAQGKLNPMSAFLQGKLKATGKVMLAQKLGELFKAHAAKL